MRRRWSPNADDRPAGCAIDALILHYTGMPNAAAALARLCDPAALVSAHYLIDEDGEVVQLVPEERRAWHAGISSWAGRARLNDCSIGIELVNPGHEWGYRPFTEAQYGACVALCRAILARWPIAACRVLAHSDVAPGRKQDPGELFDWYRLHVEGIANWPTPRAIEWSDEQFFQALAAYGYDLVGPPKANVDPQLARRAACVAFCRHFRPAILRPVPDLEMKTILAGLVDKPVAQS